MIEAKVPDFPARDFAIRSRLLVTTLATMPHLASPVRIAGLLVLFWGLMPVLMPVVATGAEPIGDEELRIADMVVEAPVGEETEFPAAAVPATPEAQPTPEDPAKPDVPATPDVPAKPEAVDEPFEPLTMPASTALPEPVAMPAPLAVPGAGMMQGAVAAEVLDEVSARSADGLWMDELDFEEMPFEASSGSWFSSGRRYGSAEILWMNRSRNYRRVLGYDPTMVSVRNPAMQTNLAGTFTTTGVPFDLSPAARLTIGEHLERDSLDRDRSLEFTYYGGQSFFLRDSYNAMPGSFLVTPLAGTIVPGLPGFTFAETYESTNGSIFNSMELNYTLGRRLGRDQLVMSPSGGWSRHAERGWLPSLLVGTRVANVNEWFTLTGSRRNVSASQFSGSYAIQTQNWLWGVNIGGELISQNEFYYWGLRGRVTPAISFAANQQAAAGLNTLPQPPAPLPNVASGAFSWRNSADQVGAGFLGDLTILAGWQVTPNFAVQVGYDFLWVAGLATATRQFNLDNVRPNSIDAGGQIFYNGLSMGIEGSW